MASPPPITAAEAPDLDQVGAWLKKMIAERRFVELVVAILSLLTRLRDLNTELVRKLADLKKKRPPSETLERLERQLAKSNGKEPEKRKRTRSPRAGGRPPLPPHLPRVDIPNNVPADQRKCPICGAEMKTVRPSICETLSIVPAKLVVRRRIDETIACPNDDTIVSAPPPPAIVERGKLHDSIIVEALADKYLEHLPIERQCVDFARRGVEIAPQTLGRSVMAAIDVLEPIAKLIREQTRGPGLLATDASGIPILDPKATMGIRTGSMWCWTNARWVTFSYSPVGDSDSVRRFLGADLARTVQCDGTNIMTFVERAGGKRPGCWSHGRRRVVSAAKLGDKIALEGVRLMARLFAIEKASALAGENAEQRRARRDAESRPLIEELRAWIEDKRATTPPKTPLGRGLNYLYRQWRRLVLFLDDGNIELTNNRRERELRRLVLGRKNWLFTWLDDGGDRTAAILTVIATCIAHDVNPRAYLHIVTKLIVNGWPKSKLRDLLPDRILATNPDVYVGEEREAALPDAPAALLLGA